MEFFDDLDRERRGQVWGMTFPLGLAATEAAAAFAVGFRQLLERLGDRLMDRLQAESHPERRSLMVGFPGQVASIEAPLSAFIAEAFGKPETDPSPLLRGIDLTSATQEGTPIDRLTGAIARAFGLSQQHVARLRPQEGRSYFLAQLLRDVIFNEAMLVSGGATRQRRRRLAAIAAGLAALLMVGAAGGGLWRAYVAGLEVCRAPVRPLALCLVRHGSSTRATRVQDT